MKRRALLMTALIFILTPNILFAGIYKCVDGNGNISFATEPKPGCSLLQESAGSERLALLIGNSNYGRSGSLPNPVNDVRAMKRALERLGFKVIKHENCTQREMKMAMDDFGSRLKGQDVGLFFYAGHGVQVSRYNYLVPVNARLSNEGKVEYNCVRADRVLAEMEGAGSRTNIVILDACRDNPFERSWRRGTHGTGLAFMNAPSGSLIAYSTAPGKTALDGGGKNSPYVSALLQHIDIPGLTVLEMFQGVRSTVMAKSDGKQIPWESTSLRGNFYFNKDGVPISTEKPLPDPPLKEKNDLTDVIKLQIQAQNLEESGKFPEAIKIRDKIIALEPDDASAYHGRANAYFMVEQYAKALQDCDRAIELKPAWSIFYTSRGNFYSHLDQNEKAIQDYSRAIELKPSDISSYYNRGLVYNELGRNVKALQDFDRVIELAQNPNFRYSNYFLQHGHYGRGYAYLYLEQYVKAIHDLDKAIELGLKIERVYYLRGDSYLYLKQYVKAIQDYDKAIEINPEDGFIYLGRGDAYFYLEQYVKAIQNYDKAIELYPESGWAYEKRGRAYMILNREEQGCADLEKACDLGKCNYFKMGIKNGACR